MVCEGQVWHDGRRRWRVVSIYRGLVTLDHHGERVIRSTVWLRRECRRRT
jgi:hypothetical protein